MSVYRIDKLMAEARRLAAEYRRQTGKALAISGEIAISDAINILGLEAAPSDSEGYDATQNTAGVTQKIQIKARVVFDETRRPHRLGQLRLEQDWQVLMLVLMDDNYESVEIWQASHENISDALGDAKPNRRGTISVAKFRKVGELIWTRTEAPQLDRD
jgi:hypothetical protein